jgi:hypothetical protein
LARLCFIFFMATLCFIFILQEFKGKRKKKLPSNKAIPILWCNNKSIHIIKKVHKSQETFLSHTR